MRLIVMIRFYTTPGTACISSCRHKINYLKLILLSTLVDRVDNDEAVQLQQRALECLSRLSSKLLAGTINLAEDDVTTLENIEERLEQREQVREISEDLPQEGTTCILILDGQNSVCNLFSPLHFHL